MTDEMIGFYKAVENLRDCRIFSIVPWTTRGEFSVLKSIEMCEQKYQSRVGVSMMAQALKQAPPMVSRTLGSLEKKGLIVREIDTSDRRNTNVRLTEEGRELIRKVDEAMLQYAEEVFSEYGQQELGDLVQKINRLHEVMQNVLEKREKEIQRGETDE